MKTNSEVYAEYEENNEDGFDHASVVSNLTDMVRWSLERKDYKDAAKNCYALGMLGIEIEYLGLTNAQINNLIPHLS
jgi:hypothetical protein